MDDWNEVRTAAFVARLGTISAAAEALGVHRATVNRHIDHLEAGLGAKLFQRHARGFTPTELGRELLRVANATDAQFGELQRLAEGQLDELSGELVVTSVDVLSFFVLPYLNRFGEANPHVATRYIATDTVLKLEYGEAHIAFRIGPKPGDPDNVVREVARIPMGLYATARYVDRHGLFDEREFGQHKFIGPQASTPRAPFVEWIRTHVPRENLTLTSNSIGLLWSAVLAGSGIGFLPVSIAERHDDLIEQVPPRPEWEEPIWTVTHVDLHRTAKVQAFLKLTRKKSV